MLSYHHASIATVTVTTATARMYCTLYDFPFSPALLTVFSPPVQLQDAETPHTMPFGRTCDCIPRAGKANDSGESSRCRLLPRLERRETGQNMRQ